MSCKLNDAESRESAGPLVIKVGGTALETPAEAVMVAAAIASLHRCWTPGVVVVHGGGSEVDRHLARLGLISEKRDGIRITPSDQIDEVVAVLAGKVNKRFVGQLQVKGVAAVGLCLGDGFLMRTVKADQYHFDPGHVGKSAGGDPLLVQTLLPAGFVPVLCSIGLDERGQALNVNADDAAADMAKLLGAETLVFLTDVEGVLDAGGELIKTLTPEEADVRIDRGEICGGMVAKVRSAIRAANESHMPVTIASWRRPETLMRFSPFGWPGTRVMPSSHLSYRKPKCTAHVSSLGVPTHDEYLFPSSAGHQRPSVGCRAIPRRSRIAAGHGSGVQTKSCGIPPVPVGTNAHHAL